MAGDYISMKVIKDARKQLEPQILNLINKIQDTRCIFRASVATLSGLSTEKSHEQVLLKSIKVCKYK